MAAAGHAHLATSLVSEGTEWEPLALVWERGSALLSCSAGSAALDAVTELWPRHVTLIHSICPGPSCRLGRCQLLPPPPILCSLIRSEEGGAATCPQTPGAHKSQHPVTEPGMGHLGVFPSNTKEEVPAHVPTTPGNWTHASFCRKPVDGFQRLGEKPSAPQAPQIASGHSLKSPFIL